MAGKKISELQALTEITGQEMIPVARTVRTIPFSLPFFKARMPPS